MIRKSLMMTKEATFAIELPNAQYQGMPTPTGTGFFVSPDGWFITAAHVITENGRSDGRIRNDLQNAIISKETRLLDETSPLSIMCNGLLLAYIDPTTDIALLKVDFQKNSQKEWLKGKIEFPYIEISTRELEEGEPVYSFGYPLPEASFNKQQHIIVGHITLCPRITSAIVSSTFEKSKMVMASNDPRVYILDKALNYGNSGGPIVATETGKVHAICSRFQPVYVPQSHLVDKNGKLLKIMTPSLYGVVASLGNLNILKEIKERNIPISNK
jgi:hypothetical protein